MQRKREGRKGREGRRKGRRTGTHPASKMNVMTPMDHISTGLP